MMYNKVRRVGLTFWIFVQHLTFLPHLFNVCSTFVQNFQKLSGSLSNWRRDSFFTNFMWSIVVEELPSSPMVLSVQGSNTDISNYFIFNRFVQTQLNCCKNKMIGLCDWKLKQIVLPYEYVIRCWGEMILIVYKSNEKLIIFN